MSQLTKNQFKKFSKMVAWGKSLRGMDVIVRYDDRCGNGHNSFSITAQVWDKNKINIIAGGCLHEDIAKHFPELQHLIKWHFCNSDAPMHYIANTLYFVEQTETTHAHLYRIDKDFGRDCVEYCTIQKAKDYMARRTDLEMIPDVKTAKEPNLAAARVSAIAPGATLEQLRSKEWLMARLPALMAEFKKDIEALGFVY